MFQRLRKHLTPSTAIAFLALVFAVTGGAFAASSHSGSSGARATASTSVATAAKSKAKTKAGARGPAGPKGATGATGPAGAAGPTGPAGAAGAKGENGAIGGQGPEGPKGTAGTNGTNGTNGTTGFTKTLPKGEVETGTFSYGMNKAGPLVAGVPISFSIPLEKPIGPAAVHYVTTEQQKEENNKTPPAQCLGKVEDPTAAEGNLCVYQGGTRVPGGELNVHNILPPSEPYSFAGSTAGAGTSGAILGVYYTGPEEEGLPVGAFLDGSWAVAGN